MPSTNTTENCESLKAEANGVAEENDVKDPASKRSKTTSLLTELVSPDVLERESEIRQSYTDSKPYPHAHIENIFQPDFLAAMKEEIKSQSKVSFKESDLFRVFQSIDLANLIPDTELANSLPNVMKLRQILYSQEWRTLVERLANLPPSTLTSQIDCACNAHAPGCHLLCHDDGIGTRKISYIIYLTEEDWKPEEGGSLELYGPQNDSPESSPLPVARVWPMFNSMAFFAVLPGASFHAVQEVVGSRPRLSLQGWYHAAEPPENLHEATLQQLKTHHKKEENNTDNDKKSVPNELENSAVEQEFSEDDKQYLSNYLQAVYLTEDSLNEVQKKFEDESSVHLQNFFQPKWVPKQEPQKQSVFDDSYYTSGISAEWKLQGPAHKQRFLEYQPDCPNTEDSNLTGTTLHHLQTHVFESPNFARFLKRITSLGTPTSVKSSKIRRFRPGLDYTVAHYGLLVDQAVLDATMCFVHDADDDNDVWECGDAGGFECYIAADDEDEKEAAADEYDEEDDTELLSVSASNNTLSLVYRDPGTMRFVKYVGFSAPSSRYDICMEFEVPEGDDDDDEEGGKLVQVLEGDEEEDEGQESDASQDNKPGE
jgi:Rps23 Pro-64 3,4-dihydroxylase Tpa1-like proline 4-hydroxylase